MNNSNCGGRFKPAGDDETGSALDAAGAMGLADPAAAAAVVAWMELACCAGSGGGGTGDAGAHSGLSMPAKEMETAR